MQRKLSEQEEMDLLACELFREDQLNKEIEKRECETYFEFFNRAWPILEPKTNLKINWHIEYICNELEAEIHRIGKGLPKDTDLIINIPPRSAKSHLVSVMLCPWAWTIYPHLRFINASHSAKLSTKHCVMSRMLIQSDWYQDKWGSRFKLVDDQNQKTNFRNNHMGERIATSVGASIMGEGADIITADDLMDASQAASDAERNAANDFWDQSLYSRLNDPAVGLRIIVMQRLHDDDTTGHALKVDEKDTDNPDFKERPDEYKHISIPAEHKGYIHPPELSQFYKEGLFFPERFTRSFLDKAVRILGSLGYACQYLEKVSPPEGNIWKRNWFNFTDKMPEDWQFETMTQSWDCTFKDGYKNDYVVGQVWGRLKGKHYLVRQVRDKMDINKTIEMILKFTLWHPKAIRKLIEDKANGPAIISLLQSKINGLVAIPKNSGDSKEACYIASAPIIESGAIILLNPTTNQWVEDYLQEVTRIPNSENDDQADATAQYLLNEEKDSLDSLKNFLKLF